MIKKYNHVLLILFVFSYFTSYAQPSLRNIIDSVNSENLLNTIKELSGFVPITIDSQQVTITTRHLDKPGNEYARRYIQQRLSSYGLQSTLQYFNTDGKNILVEIPGYQYPDKKYIICAHYDDEPNTAIAPGADDNASGISAVMEAARILKEYSFPYTLIFAFWDEEEHGKLGSLFYAQNARAAGDSILGVINFDMIGYDSNNDNIAELHSKDTARSHEISAKIKWINTLYNVGLTIKYFANGRTSSDHESFWLSGYSAAYLCQDHDDFDPRYHTASDSVVYINLDYLTKITKVSIASLASLASTGFALPVELAAFTSIVNNNEVILNWQTVTETNNKGFEVQRKNSNSGWQALTFVKGNGTSVERHLYTFTDKNVLKEKYSYRLKQIDFNGQSEFSKEIEADVTTPIQFSLEQNYPNPFNPSTMISFTLTNKGIASLKVFDLLGKEITTLVNRELPEGRHSFTFNASSVPSGIYIYKLQTENNSLVRKMMVLK